jgi:hypothetical protein
MSASRFRSDQSTTSGGRESVAYMCREALFCACYEGYISPRSKVAMFALHRQTHLGFALRKVFNQTAIWRSVLTVAPDGWKAHYGWGTGCTVAFDFLPGPGGLLTNASALPTPSLPVPVHFSPSWLSYTFCTHELPFSA